MYNKIKEILTNRLVTRENGDIDSDEFNDLLTIEILISKLHKEGVITLREVNLLYAMGERKGVRSIAKFVGMDKNIVLDTIDMLCKLLQDNLGDEFSDASLINSILQKNKLSKEEEEILRSKINER